MIHLTASMLAMLFLVLAGIHLYWAGGGRRGLDVALPEMNNRRAFTPSPLITFVVAVALLACALVVLGRTGFWGRTLPSWIFVWATWALALLFLLRALGDFKFVGFFKRVRNTRFARWDAVLFSPLCFLVSVLLFLIARS